MSDVPEAKYLVTVKNVEKAIKLDEFAKAELHSVGMMDDKGKLKTKRSKP